MNLCPPFKRLAINTWGLIDQGRNVGFRLNEETITDLLLLDLKTHYRNEVFVHKFNKHEEGKNAADWEWWFYGYGKWLGFRIQAKVLDIRSGKFEHLHYRKDSASKYQCDRLIEEAHKGVFPKRPLYCLYLSTENRVLLGSLTRRRYGIADLFGCSLLSPYEVQKLRPRGLKRLEDTQRKMVPWHCLVCHSSATERNILQKINNFAAKHFDEEMTEATEYLLYDCPTYVKAVFLSQENREAESPDENLGGIALFAFSDLKETFGQ